MVKALRDSQDREALWWDVDEFLVGRKRYIETARNRACRTFGVVMDGKWYERGSMGWWGCVSDEKDEETWSVEFNSLVDNLPGDTVLTVVDCHI
jgi:hypothetical protein